MSPSPSATRTQPTEPQGKIQTIRLDRILPLAETSSIRAGGLNMEHVQAMMLNLDALPPIHIVALGGGQFGRLRGAHRYEAHRLHKGTSSIKALVVDVPREEWFAYAVRDNSTSGLPLTLDEKKAAANRMLSESDRPVKDIAIDCGLSHDTVTKMEKELEETARSTYENRQVEHPRVRLSQDGKRRPTRKGEAVTRAKAVAEANPKASAREIAKEAGVSTGTAHKGRRLTRTPSTGTSGAKPTKPTTKVADDDGLIAPAEVINRLVLTNEGLEYSDLDRFTAKDRRQLEDGLTRFDQLRPILIGLLRKRVST
jgi:hypothetical protein